jgi:predicted MFS family arabinose efflux permease
MNKRGGAFGAFNAIWGVMWFLGSALMGFLYDHSVLALVIFGMSLQVVAASAFFWLRGRLAEEMKAS